LSSKISIVIPALNEEAGIGKTLDSIPRQKLVEMGYEIEVVVVDNASIDKTGEIARKLGAIVVYEPKRGYGVAYKAGFSNASGDIIVTCDADGTYPIEDVPRLIGILNEQKLDFLNTNRFLYMNNGAMSLRNKLGNNILTMVMRSLYHLDIKDSQSGMWIFKRNILNGLNLEYATWDFSQELKLEACFYARCKWNEIPINYYNRVGHGKLNGWVAGFRDLYFLFKKRIRR
jgi:glycosyltransferase involved in cell wall biosynthesis